MYRGVLKGKLVRVKETRVDRDTVVTLAWLDGKGVAREDPAMNTAKLEPSTQVQYSPTTFGEINNGRLPAKCGLSLPPTASQ